MRLIDADVLSKKWQDVIDRKPEEKDTVAYLTFQLFIERLKEEPTIDPERLRPKGRWEWFEEWLPSTPDHVRECLDCGWLCGKCRMALEDMVGGYWDNPDEKPELNYCPNCGAKMEDNDARD